MIKEKIKNIEILRFVGALGIIYFHLSSTGVISLFSDEIPLYKFLYNGSRMGFHWVDFFFIISGFFMFYTTDFSISFKEFFKKKIFRFLPIIWFAVFVYMFLSWFGVLNYKKYINLFTLFLINNIGLTSGNSMGNIHPVWFVSALFWAMMCIFYLKTLLKDRWFNFVMAITVFWVYVFVCNTTTHAPVVKYSFINIGVIRALGGLATGYFISEWYKDYINTEHKSLNLFQTLLITVLEGYLLVLIIRDTLFYTIDFNNSFIYIMFFIPLFILFLLRKGYISKLLNNNLSVWLGKYSYSMFVIHIIVQDLLYKNLWKVNPNFVMLHPIINIIIPFFLVLLFGIFTFHNVEIPASKYLKDNFINNIEPKRGGGGTL